MALISTCVVYAIA